MHEFGLPHKIETSTSKINDVLTGHFGRGQVKGTIPRNFPLLVLLWETPFMP